MDVVQTHIQGLLVIKPKVFRDARGYFLETWHQERYEANGIAMPFVQDNRSRSTRGVLRGLHFQRRFPQGKLISVSRGAVFDVAVDIRADSPTFGAWYGVELNEDNQHQLWVPPGMAHGFCVLSDVVDFAYKCTERYRPDDEGSIRWNDPDIGIAWPDMAFTLSDKDSVAPFFRDATSMLSG